MPGAVEAMTVNCAVKLALKRIQKASSHEDSIVSSSNGMGTALAASADIATLSLKSRSMANQSFFTLLRKQTWSPLEPVLPTGISKSLQTPSCLYTLLTFLAIWQ